jgi:Ni/Fe-hydrogenase subunit HybB-like protein
MPVVFLFSAIVSGISAVMLLYMALSRMRRVPIDMRCVDTIAKYLFYAFLIDFALELLDLIHRLYEADESLRALDFMVKTRLFTSQIVLQIVLGTAVPIALLALVQVKRLTEKTRVAVYSTAGMLTLIGIFAMRWNVVIGGQLFSKTFLGYTTYKMGFARRKDFCPRCCSCSCRSGSCGADQNPAAVGGSWRADVASVSLYGFSAFSAPEPGGCGPRGPETGN